MTVTYQVATSRDLDLLLPVFVDMERFYDGEQAIAADQIRERLGRALNGEPNGMILMALDEEALGFAALTEIFPGAALRTLWYLKDLYVRSDLRRRTIGEGLMRAAAREVIARGGHRLEFTTDSRNKAAQRFYSRLGAKEVPKIFYRFLDADLKALANEEERHFDAALLRST